MGIPFMNKLLNSYSLSQVHRLKNQKLVVDLTKPHWFLKKFMRPGSYDKHPQDINRFDLQESDRFGGNLIELDHLFRHFFTMLKEANIDPILVYPGISPSEHESILGSKVIYMEKSCKIAMKVNCHPSPRNHLTVADLIVPLIRRITRELGMDRHVEQCAYEVYPILAHLASQFDCEVLTNHADFIMLNVRRGFFQWEGVPMELNAENELVVNVYTHRKLLEAFRITNTGSSLSSLLTLMREDFQGIYFREINELFQLRYTLRYNDGKFIDRGRPFKQGNEFNRLIEVLGKWNQLNFTSVSDVRARISSLPSLIKEFDVVHRTFTEPLTLDIFLPRSMSHFDIMSALTKRESTADFLVNVMCNRKIFNRIGVEDCNTILSTFSLGNATRELVMVESQVKELKIFDRERSQMVWNSIKQDLNPNNFRSIPGDQRIFKQIFRFPPDLVDENHLRQWIEAKRRGKDFVSSIALDLDASKELVIVMLLIRYAFHFGFRRKSKLSQLKEKENLENRSTSSSLNQEVADPLTTKYRNLKIIFSRAVYNCFMYYYGTGVSHNPNTKPDPRVNDRTLVTDKNLIDREFFPQLAILTNTLKLPKVQVVNNCLSEDNYINRRHCIELLNSIMNAYCELNSLFNYPATTLNFNRWFNGQLIYKIMRFDHGSNGEYLMKLDADLIALINTEF